MQTMEMASRMNDDTLLFQFIEWVQLVWQGSDVPDGEAEGCAAAD